MAKDEKEKAEEMRKQRNKAWAERRGLSASVAKCQRVIKARDKKVAVLQERQEKAEQEVESLAIEVEDVQGEPGEAGPCVLGDCVLDGGDTRLRTHCWSRGANRSGAWRG